MKNKGNSKFRQYLEASSHQKFYPGYEKGKDGILKMSDQQLLDYLDGMYGRKNLSEDYTHDDLLVEALEQCRKDFITPEGETEEKTWSEYARAVYSQFKQKA